jgi:hypothetical protein
MELRDEYKKKYPNSILSFSKKKEKKGILTIITNVLAKDDNKFPDELRQLLDQNTLATEAAFKKIWVNLFGKLKDPAKKVSLLIQLIDICLKENFSSFKNFINNIIAIDAKLFDNLLDNIATQEEYRYILIQFIQHDIPLRLKTKDNLSLLRHLCENRQLNKDVAGTIAIEFLLAFDTKSIGIMTENQESELLLFCKFANANTETFVNGVYLQKPVSELLKRLIHVTALYDKCILTLCKDRPPLIDVMSTNSENVTPLFSIIQYAGNTIVRLLLNNGANPLRLCTEEKISPFRLAVARNRYSALDILKFIENDINKYIGCDLMNEITSGLSQSAGANEKLFKKLHTLNSKLKKATDEKIESLKNENKNLKNEKEELKKENKRLQWQNTNLDEKLKKAEDENEQLKKELAALKNKSANESNNLSETKKIEDEASSKERQATQDNLISFTP